MAEVRVPRDTVNDDVVTLVTWHRAAGESVRKGEKLLSVETSKALIDVDAEADGTLHILRPGGEQVPVGDLVGHILAAGEALPADASPPKAAVPASTSAAPTSAAPATPPAAPTPVHANGAASNGAASAAAAASAAKPGGPVFSKRAEALVAERGLDRALFAAMGLVREEDVRRLIDDGAPAATIEPEPAPARTAATGSVPAPASRGGIFGDALRAAGDRGVPLPELVFNYVVRNWLLGNLVKVAPRGVDLALHRMRGVKIGRDVFVDPTAILETAYPELLTIGDDARIAARAIVMCHIKAPNHLRETGLVPQVKRPVVLSESCFVGVGAVILPGVTVGRGAVVASGSVVVADVPPYTLVSGNPAKVVKRFPVPEAHR